MKRVQNIVAESRRTLPFTAAYAVVVWLLAGLIGHNMWLQFICFVLAVFMMVQLNNKNLLIRIYSRLVSSSYIALSCAALFLFASPGGACLQLTVIASLFCLFNTYLNRTSAGWTYYAFLFLGLGSLTDVHVIYFMPVFWLLMLFALYSFSMQTFVASLLGFVTPYFYSLAWYAWRGEGDISPWLHHLAGIADIQFSISYSVLSLQHLILLAFFLILFLLGSIHFVTTSYKDKIRVRQIYYSFMTLMIFSGLLIILQPQFYQLSFHIMLISVSPFIGHFLALTESRLSNILFFVLTAVVLFLSGMNLWISSSVF